MLLVGVTIITSWVTSLNELEKSGNWFTTSRRTGLKNHRWSCSKGFAKKVIK